MVLGVGWSDQLLPAIFFSSREETNSAGEERERVVRSNETLWKFLMEDRLTSRLT